MLAPAGDIACCASLTRMEYSEPLLPTLLLIPADFCNVGSFALTIKVFSHYLDVCSFLVQPDIIPLTQ